MNDYRYFDFVKYAVPRIRKKYPGTLVYTHHIKIASNSGNGKSIDYYPKGQKAVFIKNKRTIKSVSMTEEQLFIKLGI